MIVDVWVTPGDGEVPELYADIMIMGHTLIALDIGSNEVRAAAWSLIHS